jgi:FtsP/CotA-like multicopper oxidase with cupredoxin domain
MLDLNLVEVQPGLPTSPGNNSSALFSFNGTSPGPTVRVKADGEIRIRVRNTLGMNRHETPVGIPPDPIEFTPDQRAEVCELADATLLDSEDPSSCLVFRYPEEQRQVARFETRPGWSLKGHMNAFHCEHTTNLHFHGLHVNPGANPDGSHSDNVSLRLIPREDYAMRQHSGDENLATLGEHEHVGELEYAVQLAFDHQGQRTPHPPGTHWYHPHAHGSTNTQVASGMAGYLIVEGDVDEAVNKAITGEASPEPQVKTGPFDYRERLLFIQRVVVVPTDVDAGRRRQSRRFPFPLRNDPPAAKVIKMRPGAVERWRVLNGSVDGAGTKRFMVVEGQFVQRRNRLWRVVVDEPGSSTGESGTRHLLPAKDSDFETAKVDLHQLSFDGITLVREENGKAVHYIKDLSEQNAGTENPFAVDVEDGENEIQARESGFEAVFRNGDSLRRSFVRPNEVYLTNANRTDLFFKAPLDAGGKVFTIIAKEAHIHTDHFQAMAQEMKTNDQVFQFRPLFDVIVGYIHVTGEQVAGGDFDLQSLNSVLPAVPPLLQPIRTQELTVPEEEALVSGVPAGSSRTRTISYSGIGGAHFPLIRVPDEFVTAHPELKGVRWETVDGVNVLIPNLSRSMAIHGDFDLKHNPKPSAPCKFSPRDEKSPTVLVDTAEEWVVYNCSQMLWSNTDRERFPQPDYPRHFDSYPMTRGEGQQRHRQDPYFRISDRANDHPFHMHTNPLWVMRIEVPDETGELHNVLPEPMWMDTVAVPRNGGRVVFRTRFDDFQGEWVNHCHVLAHEDNGMMQHVMCTDDPGRVNYRWRDEPSAPEMTGDQVTSIYPRPSLDLMYQQNMNFVDLTQHTGGTYPGFSFATPSLDDLKPG